MPTYTPDTWTSRYLSTIPDPARRMRPARFSARPTPARKAWLAAVAELSEAKASLAVAESRYAAGTGTLTDVVEDQAWVDFASARVKGLRARRVFSDQPYIAPAGVQGGLVTRLGQGK